VAIAVSSTAAASFNGMHFIGFGPGAYLTEDADQSFQELVELVDWTTVVVVWYQDNMNSTTIKFDPDKCVNDTDIAHVIQNAHSHDMKVGLKPHVDFSDDPTHWRGEIGMYFDEDDWNAWFDSYSKYMQHMATLAATYGAEMLIIGTELTSTESRESDWRSIVHTVAKIYNGDLVYGANWGVPPNGPYAIKWWDAVDYIGIDAYYPVSKRADPSLTQLEVAWKAWEKTFIDLSKYWGMRIIFTEIGYESKNDTSMHPWSSSGALDMQAQANCYQAVYDRMFNADWFRGLFWWGFTTDPGNGGLDDSGFSPHNKPAQLIVESH
jgi:hypothetical protein